MSDTRKFDPQKKETPDGGLQNDTLLANRYRIMGTLGGGGMGTVYQARDTHFPEAKRLVAIKEMITPLTNDPAQQEAMLKTFQREANILAALSHPAIPKIYDFFILEPRAYLVMEYINGSDLDALLLRTRSLPIERVVEWAIELCDVLEYLHNNKPQPIIFRDVKPANIMIDSLGKVRLIDFGIAKIFESDKKHTMIGTEGYSAPEQYRGDVRPSSDIYGLGATLHHVLTRKDPRTEPPFTFHERPIARINPTVPQALIDIIDKALQQRVEDRFASCAEMRQQLELVRNLLPSLQATGVIQSAPQQGTSSQSPSASPLASSTVSATSVAAPATNFFGPEGNSSAPSTQVRWKFKTEDEIRASPTIFRGTVYVGSYDTNMWAINANTGQIVWKLPTGGGIASSPTVDPSTKLVIFGSEDHLIYAADITTGRVSWTYSTDGKVRAAPRIAHNHVFIGSDDGYLYALVAQTGRFLWKFEAGSAIRSRPFVTNEIVIFGTDDGTIYGVELSGKRKWSMRTKRTVHSSPYVDPVENVCFVGSLDNFVYALDASSGYTLWRFRTGGPVLSSPTVIEDTVFIGSTDGKVYAINANAGKEKWQIDLQKPIVASPVIHNNFLYIGTAGNSMHCLDVKTGKQIWKFDTGGQITSTGCAEDNLLVFGSLDYHLYALPIS